MATKEELYQIGLGGFEAVDRFFAHPPPPRPPRNFPFSRPFPRKPQELYGNRPAGWVPGAETVTVDNVKAAQCYGGITRIDYGRSPPPGPPRNIQFNHHFPLKQPNPPKRMGEGKEHPPVGPYQVRYLPQELYGNRPAGRFPASDAAAKDIVKAA
ncbi:hypothetical protein CDL15_Pgr016720 [Punica granatum]|uniref:Uncharacterized protein n=1 Tax=Punica granatum TaxID=22663 RepID=A0A218XSY6_PUNGR|nr:hypothetical protein CDL15_Pgr016720 [Punica granatum]PKH64236.1 hypothetical protein CRG98_050194 [Punica granatum]